MAKTKLDQEISKNVAYLFLTKQSSLKKFNFPMAVFQTFMKMLKKA